jgi:hypothetical protein
MTAQAILGFFQVEDPFWFAKAESIVIWSPQLDQASGF